jgi:nitrite reductase/ring-hydroxylating ferredoxin subunit
MAYHPVAKTAELKPGTMKPVTANGKKVLLANVDGAFYAMQQKCPHLGANLCRGRLAGKTITCPLHSATFDITTVQDQTSDDLSGENRRRFGAGRGVDPALVP